MDILTDMACITFENGKNMSHRKQSLCKNLERADTKRWLTETLETLMKERSGEEKKEEGKKLEVRATSTPSLKHHLFFHRRS